MPHDGVAGKAGAAQPTAPAAFVEQGVDAIEHLIAADRIGPTRKLGVVLAALC